MTIVVVYMNVLAKNQKVVVCVVPSLHVYIIICYESKIWSFALHGSSCYYSNKDSCFSCSEHGYFFLLWGKKAFVSVVSVSSRDFLVLKHILKMTHTLCRNKIEWTEYGWRAWTVRESCRFVLWLGFNKLLEMLIGDENMDTFIEDAMMRLSIFL